jgi:hypothetical protein
MMGAYQKMTLGRDANQVDGVSVVRSVEHVECLAKAEIAQDIHSEPVAPVRHVLRRAPPLALVEGAPIVADALTEGPDVAEDIPFDLLDGTVGEGV